MNHIEHRAKTSSTEAGLFAALSRLLHLRGSGAPSRIPLVLVLVLVAIASVLSSLAFAGAPAQAAIAHRYLSQLTGTPTGSFGSNVCGVTVDPASQDVYVADPRSDAIDIFNSSGVYQSRITGQGIPQGSFSEDLGTCSVAVSDKTGDVYFAQSRARVVYVFNASGGYVTTMRGSGTPAQGGYPTDLSATIRCTSLWISQAAMCMSPTRAMGLWTGSTRRANTSPS